MPAVSTRRTGPSSVSITVSIESRVVPGRSWTTDRSSPVSWLKRVDLPTLGRPTMATATPSGEPAPASGAAGSPAPAGSAPGSASGRRATTASNRSPVPRPWSALTGYGSPRPRPSSSQTMPSRLTSSTLLATSSAGLPNRRSSSATLLSSPVTPVVTSTTRSTTSASAMARSACWLTLASRSLPPTIHPPVSTSRNGRPSQSASTSLRSRVTPGRSSTMAARRPTIRLSSVDLPTLGRPTMATTDRSTSAPRPSAEGRPQRVAVGGDDLDRQGQVPGTGAIEEPALREAHVRQEVAMPGRLVREHPGQVGPHHQARHRHVPAEVPVVDRHDPDGGQAQPFDQRPEDAGAVRRGQDCDRGSSAGTDPEQLVAGGPDAAVGLVVGVGRPRQVRVGRAEEPATVLGRRPGPGPEQLGLEGARHTDAVLVHGEVAVDLRIGERPVGEEVVLVGREDHAAAEGGREDVLPVVHAVHHRDRLGPGVGAHARLRVEARHAEGHHAHRRQLGVAIEHPG